jgi:hypothetical protein
VSTWQARLVGDGAAGLLRDNARKPGKTLFLPGAAKRIVDQALTPPPGKTVGLTSRILAAGPVVSPGAAAQWATRRRHGERAIPNRPGPR